MTRIDDESPSNGCGWSQGCVRDALRQSSCTMAAPCMATLPCTTVAGVTSVDHQPHDSEKAKRRVRDFQDDRVPSAPASRYLQTPAQKSPAEIVRSDHPDIRWRGGYACACGSDCNSARWPHFPRIRCRARRCPSGQLERMSPTTRFLCTARSLIRYAIPGQRKLLDGYYRDAGSGSSCAHNMMPARRAFFAAGCRAHSRAIARSRCCSARKRCASTTKAAPLETVGEEFGQSGVSRVPTREARASSPTRDTDRCRSISSS